MKVICAGMSKTGTKSVHAALNRLGYSPVHDYGEAFQHFGKDFLRFTDEGWSVEEFRRMYENVDAVVDIPAYYFWEELAEAFPDAKVILMVKDDEDVWYKSMWKQIDGLKLSRQRLFRIFGAKEWKSFNEFMEKPCSMPFGGVECNWGDVTSKFPLKIVAKQMYRRHNAHVINTCAKERLLVFNCKEGWEPLCNFLEKPVPDEPFPHVNVDSELAANIQSGFFAQERRKMWTNLALTCFSLSGIFWLLKKGISKMR